MYTAYAKDAIVVDHCWLCIEMTTILARLSYLYNQVYNDLLASIALLH